MTMLHCGVMEKKIGLYCRKETGIYYFKKMVEGKIIRISLNTKDIWMAKEISRTWHNEYLMCKLTGNQTMPILLNKEVNKQKKLVVEISQPTIIQSFNEHLIVCKNRHLYEGRMKGKENLKKIMVKMNYWRS